MSSRSAPCAAARARRSIRRVLDRRRDDDPTEDGGVTLVLVGIGDGDRGRSDLGVTTTHKVAAQRIRYFVRESGLQMTQAHTVDDACDRPPNPDAQCVTLTAEVHTVHTA